MIYNKNITFAIFAQKCFTVKNVLNAYFECLQIRIIKIYNFASAYK